MFKTVKKNEFLKNSEAKRGKLFQQRKHCTDNFVIQYKKCEIMANLNIYYLFATALVLIRSRHGKREKKLKKR